MRPNQSRGVATYLLFTLALSSVFYFLIAKSGQVGGGWGAYIGCLMWCPGVAALLSCKYLGRDLSTLGWKWGKTRYEIACYLIPLGYATAIYALVWLTGLGGFYNRQFYDRFSSQFGLGPMKPWANIALYFVFTATITVVRDCATVLGEEIGWRGFLVPELAKRHSFAATAIISGLIWAVWHYPIFLLADGYSGGTPVWYYLPLFTLLLPAISFLWTWMRLKSGSIWPGVVLHAAHNTFFQQFFDPLTVDKSKTRYIAGEFGVGLVVISILMAFYFWKRRNELAPPVGTVTEGSQRVQRT
jgi:membrane protease YdiL (CAAX protease family)